MNCCTIPGSSFPLVSSTGAVTGGFDSISITGIDPAQVNFESAGGGLVLGIRCGADFNNDRGVDGDDVIGFFGAWDVGDSAGDFNADPLHRTGVTQTYDLIIAAGFSFLNESFNASATRSF